MEGSSKMLNSPAELIYRACREDGNYGIFHKDYLSSKNCSDYYMTFYIMLNGEFNASGRYFAFKESKVFFIVMGEVSDLDKIKSAKFKEVYIDENVPKGLILGIEERRF